MTKRQEGKILDNISGDDAKRILKNLCASDSEIRNRILSEAEKVLGEVDREEVAADVQFELDGIDVEELWERSGGSRDGYSTPDEMAGEMIEEALQPYTDTMEKYRKIGMPEQSKQYLMGILKGLYCFDHEAETDFKEWAADAPCDCFGCLLIDWRKQAQASDIEEVLEFISRECPAWANKVSLGRTGQDGKADER